MNMSIKMVLAAVIAAGVYGCVQFTGVHSLRGADIAAADTAPVDLKTYAGSRPGNGQAIARTFDGQPPLVPHAVDNFDEITLGDNQCLECHSPETAQKRAAPVVADTHLVKGVVSMGRYQCNTCHVPQVDAKPLVANRFIGTPAPAASWTAK